MSDIEFKSDFEVELVDVAGSDERIVQAARVSTLGARLKKIVGLFGLINFLMRGRHGSPFEHGMLTFRLTIPDAVWWELVRHRIGFSYNLESARYKILEKVVYIPSRDRPLVQVGKAGAYEFVPGDEKQYQYMDMAMRIAYLEAWKQYQDMLDNGIAKELARMVLPFGNYRTGYVTCNPRSLMAFLSLRTVRAKQPRWRRFVAWLLRQELYPDPQFPSFPQWEIARVADLMEEHFQLNFPVTHDAFNRNGRVAP